MLQQKILDNPPTDLRTYAEDLSTGIGVEESAKRFRERTAQWWVGTIALELFDGWDGDGHPSEWLLGK